MENTSKIDQSFIVLVNKPAGISSNKVVGIVRRSVGAKKCGHLGTLDLEGEGLLPVTVGHATKLFDFFLNKDKTYETTFIFGFETDTLDMSGKVIKQKDCHIETAEVEKAIKSMIGKYAQMPPIYSAKKVGGKVAYKEARGGREILLSPKEVEIFDFKLLQKLDENVFRFLISCSSGTYIRSVCRDLAEKLSTYGTMKCILRTRCGGFFLKDANTLDEIESGNFKKINCDEVFDYAKIDLSSDQFIKISNGQKLPSKLEERKFRVYHEGQFLGVGECRNGQFCLTLRLF